MKAAINLLTPGQRVSNTYCIIIVVKIFSVIAFKWGTIFPYFLRDAICMQCILSILVSIQCLCCRNVAKDSNVAFSCGFLSKRHKCVPSLNLMETDLRTVLRSITRKDLASIFIQVRLREWPGTLHSSTSCCCWVACRSKEEFLTLEMFCLLIIFNSSLHHIMIKLILKTFPVQPWSSTACGRKWRRDCLALWHRVSGSFRPKSVKPWLGSNWQPSSHRPNMVCLVWINNPIFQEVWMRASYGFPDLSSLWQSKQSWDIRGQR